jgi:hypothetical protein
MTAFERSGWRDQELSQRHRDWGFNCPAADLDFLMVEYHLGCPVAVVDYKHYRAGLPKTDHPTYRATGQLYDDRGQQLPFFIARYWPVTWAFRVLAMNDRARKWLDSDSYVPMTERQFVVGLHRFRSVTVAERVLSGLHDEMPPPVEEDVA